MTSITALLIAVLLVFFGVTFWPQPSSVIQYDFDNPAKGTMGWVTYEKYERNVSLPNAAQTPEWTGKDLGLGKGALRVPVRFRTDTSYAAVAVSLLGSTNRLWDLEKGGLRVELLFPHEWPTKLNRDAGLRFFRRDNNNKTKWGCWYRLTPDLLAKPQRFDIDFRDLCKGQLQTDQKDDDADFDGTRIRWVGVSIEANEKDPPDDYTGEFWIGSYEIRP